MRKGAFSVPCRELGKYDVVVAGGGLAGCAAAVSAARGGAKTLLVESGGELGGDITKGLVPQLLDPEGKGGFFREIREALEQGGHTAPRRGPHTDENGRRLPGTMIETEYLKAFLDEALLTAGADVLYYGMVSAAECEERRIRRALLCTEAGNYAVEADEWIDATGSGSLAALAGCAWDYGHPDTGDGQAASMGMLVTGLGEKVRSTDTEKEKFALKRKIEEAGIGVSSNQVGLIAAAEDGCWLLNGNFQYGVLPEDAFAHSRATSEGRMESVRFAEAMRKLPGFENTRVLKISSHLGIREGRRIRGLYSISREDVVSGRSFADGLFTIRFCVDVHATAREAGRVVDLRDKTKPYTLPYRCLVAADRENLFLAGRCISGDFFAHASYRVAANCVAMGEAAGFAAATCVKEGTIPARLDAKRVREYMRRAGYELLPGNEKETRRI